MRNDCREKAGDFAPGKQRRAKQPARLTVYETAELAVLCALMFGGKEALRNIPNVHPVTMFLILTIMLHGWKAFYPVIGFVILELAIYGVGMWSLIYVFVWPVTTLLLMIFRKNQDFWLWAILAAISGITFGALCEIPFIFVIGFPAAVTAWLAGIPYDLIHCVSNFLITLICLPPLYKLSVKLRRTAGVMPEKPPEETAGAPEEAAMKPEE
ncbi:MAG: hypothetical protein J6Z38_01620 [Lachnospiraceae bacterium]|nr:hypothetical protein [Lachnospiraceae bacterium]